VNILRDAELQPLVKEMAEKRRFVYLREARDVLLAAWPKRGARRALLRAVLGLAVDFRTWQTLCRREELDDRTAVALMVRLVTAVGGGYRAATSRRAEQDLEPLEAHQIRATFSDGGVKDIDLGELLSAGGVFTPIYERREIFEQVRVNPESGTVEWPGEVDFDPEVLYGR
jgi:hypothetical protein